MGAPELAIIVPAFNAARTLARTLLRIPQAKIPGAVIYLVDDGSRDQTAEEARRAAARMGIPIEVIRHPKNRGYGAAQKTGFRRSLDAGCRYHALIHADGQYDPGELPRIIAPLAKGRAEVVVGSRIASGKALEEGMPLLRYLGNRWISWAENRVFGLNFVEYHTGYLAYSSRALGLIQFETLSDRFHFDGEMMLCAGKLGLPVAEVPVSTYYGPETSSLSPARYLLEVSRVLLRYLRRGYFFQKPSRGRGH